MTRSPLRSMSLLSVALAFAIQGCKTAESSGVRSEDGVAAAPAPGGGDNQLCQQLLGEARAKAARPGGSIRAYEEVFARERGVADLILAKARSCSAGANEYAQDKPKVEGRAAGGDANPPGVYGADQITARTAIPQTVDPSCEGLTDGKAVAEQQARLNSLRTCDPYDPAITEQIHAALAPKQGEPGFKLAEGEDTAEEAEAASTLCKTLNLDNKYCARTVDGALELGETETELLCRALAFALSPEESKNPLFSKNSLKSCSAGVGEDMCLNFTAAGIEAARAANAGEVGFGKALKKAAVDQINKNIVDFMRPVRACLLGVATTRLEHIFEESAKQFSKTVFGKDIGKAEKWLGGEMKRALAAQACTVATTLAVNALGKTSDAKLQKGCSDIVKFDKHRIGACMETTKNFTCDAFLGFIDLSETLGLPDDEESMRKMWADMASWVVEGGCEAGGKVTTAACSIINKSATHIIGALRGESNPWADCVGTPAMGACLAQKWNEFQTGTLSADFQVGRSEAIKNDNNQKFENRLCWCWRRCRSSDWGRDREVHKGLWFTVAEKGDAGVRFCAARGRTTVWPAGKLTIEQGHRDVYIGWDSCEVSTARGDTPQLMTKDGFVEIFSGNQWRWYKMDAPGTCGGVTDQGI